VSDLATRASAIVVGTVASRVEATDGISFDIQVERVLSGNVAGAIVHVKHAGGTGPAGAIGTVNKAFHGVWFLVPGASGQSEVLRATSSPFFDGLFFPAPTGPPSGVYAYAPSTVLADGLAFEVAAGIEAGGGGPVDLLEALGSTDTPAVRSILNQYVSSAKPGFQAVGIAGLLARSAPGSVATLTGLWPSISGDRRAHFAASALKAQWRDPTPSAVQEVGAMMVSSSSSSELRDASVRALAAVHTKEALPYLVGLLTSSDHAERAQGVFGLSSFANGCAMQTNDNVTSMSYLRCNQPSAYRTQSTMANFAFGLPAAKESATIGFWQSWWNAHPELH